MSLLKRPPSLQQISESEVAPPSPPQDNSSMDQEPTGGQGPFSYLGSIAKKTIKYLPSFLTAGPVGVAAKMASEHPKEVTDAAGSMVKSTAETAVQFPQTTIGSALRLPAEVKSYVSQKPIKETTAFKTGENIMEPTNVPILGKVKSISANPEDVARHESQTAGETAKQAADIYLTAGAPGASELLGKAGKVIKDVFPESKGAFSKVAELFSNVPARQIESAASPEMAQAVRNVRQAGLSITSPEDVFGQGDEVFKTAQKVIADAQTAYDETRAILVGANEGKLIQRSKEFVTGAEDILKGEKIKITPKGVDLVGSQFEGSSSAQGFLKRAHAMMTRPAVKGVSVADDLLTRREALTTLKNEIPFEQRNLRRVVGKMVDGFDATLEKIIGTDAEKMRAAYTSSMKTARPIVNSMMVTQGKQKVFSPDRASAFIKQVATDSKIDKRQLLEELDKLVGTTFARDVQAMGLDRAIGRLDPVTGGRVFDVVKGIVGSNSVGRLLIPLFSPKLWGELALRQGMKATKAAATASENAAKFRNLVLTNLLALPLKENKKEQ